MDFALEDAARRSATADRLDRATYPSSTPGTSKCSPTSSRRSTWSSRATLAANTPTPSGSALEPRFPTSFGSVDSFQRHCDDAARAGLSVKVAASATLAFDVDTPEDDGVSAGPSSTERELPFEAISGRPS